MSKSVCSSCGGTGILKPIFSKEKDEPCLSCDQTGIESTCTDELVCPYCGHVQFDSWELANDGEGISCDSCEKQFTYETQITRTFSSWRVACLNGSDHDFREWTDYGPFTARRCKNCSKSEQRKNEDK